MALNDLSVKRVNGGTQLLYTWTPVTHAVYVYEAVGGLGAAPDITKDFKIAELQSGISFFGEAITGQAVYQRYLYCPDLDIYSSVVVQYKDGYASGFKIFSRKSGTSDRLWAAADLNDRSAQVNNVQPGEFSFFIAGFSGNTLLGQTEMQAVTVSGTNTDTGGSSNTPPSADTAKLPSLEDFNLVQFLTDANKTAMAINLARTLLSMESPKSPDAAFLNSLYLNLFEHISTYDDKIGHMKSKLLKIQKIRESYQVTVNKKVAQFNKDKNETYTPKLSSYNALNNVMDSTIKNYYSQITAVLIDDLYEFDLKISAYTNELSKMDKLIAIKSSQLDELKAKRSELYDTIVLVEGAIVIRDKLKLVACVENALGIPTQITNTRDIVFNPDNGISFNLSTYPVNRGTIAITNVTHPGNQVIFTVEDDTGSVPKTTSEKLKITIGGGVSAGDSIRVTFKSYVPMPLESALALPPDKMNNLLLNKTTMI